MQICAEMGPGPVLRKYIASRFGVPEGERRGRTRGYKRWKGTRNKEGISGRRKSVDAVERVGHTQIREFKVRCWDTLFSFSLQSRRSLRSPPVHPALSPSPSSDWCLSKLFPSISNDDPSCYNFILGTSVPVHNLQWHRWQSFPCWQENWRGLFWRRFRR